MLTSCDAKNGCGSVSMINPSFATNQGNRPAQTLPYTQMTNCTSHQQEARQVVNYNTMRGGSPSLTTGQGMNYTGQPSMHQASMNQPSMTGVAAATVPMPGMSGISGINDMNDMNAMTGMNAMNTMSPAADPDIDPDMASIPGQPDPPAAAVRGSSSVVPESVLPEAPQIQVPANPLLPPGYQEFITYENLQYLNGFLRTQIGRYMRGEQLIGSSNLEERYGFLLAVGINYILLQELGTGNIMTIDYYSIKSLYIYYTQPSLPENPALRF